jgi:hypothetical protein
MTWIFLTVKNAAKNPGGKSKDQDNFFHSVYTSPYGLKNAYSLTKTGTKQQ